MSRKPRLEMPNIEKLLADEEKRKQREEERQAINPFGTGLKVSKADDVVVKQVSGTFVSVF